MPTDPKPKLHLVATAPDPTPRWFILQVISQRERLTAEALIDKGVTAYVPKAVSAPLHARRKAVRTRPLIPGYVFVELPDDEALDLARNFRNVISILCKDGNPWRIPAIEIGTMVFMEACHEWDETWTPPPIKGRRYSYRWKAGERVRVRSGPFEGFLATVQRGQGKDHMQVVLAIFGRQTEVVLEHRQMEGLDKGKTG